METLNGYLGDLASERPTPGGGSAATISAALGAALVAMVARITLGSPKRQDRHEQAAAIVSEGDALREQLEAARVADEAAYGAFVAAGTLPKGTPEEKAARTARMQAALAAAAEAPLETARLALNVLWLADRGLELRNTHLASDLGCAAELASAGLLAAAYNVRANHAYLRDPDLLHAQQERLTELAAEGQIVLDRVRVGVSVALAPPLL